MKVRYAESKQVKQMREKFEKDEKIALRSSKTYKVSSKTNTYSARKVKTLNSQLHIYYIYISFFQSIHKQKREKLLEITDLAKQGGGESYIDSSRGIAVGMGDCFLYKLIVYIL